MSDSPGSGPGTTSFDKPAPARPGTRPYPGPARGRKGLALVLAALAGAVVVATVVAVAALVTHHPRHVQASHPLRGTVFLLRPGQCINFGPYGTAAAHVVPCAQPHNAEIYGAFKVAGRHWPGAAVLSEQARQGCQSRLSGYLNPQLNSNGMAEFYVYPNPGAWAAGGRSVICEIRGTHGKLTGSVRAASS